MKRIYMWIITLFIVSLLISAVPAIADNPNDENNDNEDIIIPPLNDPSKAKTDPMLEDLRDPKSQNYDPSLANGFEGTRFGPPGKRSPNIPELNKKTNSALVDDHQNWGTNIFINSNIWGIYAYQKVYNNINLNESGDYLFAPTLIGPNRCPIEIITVYKRSGTTTSRYLSLSYWDNGTPTPGPTIAINASFFTNYVSDGYYIGEVIYESTRQKWHAYLYKWSTSSWIEFGAWISTQSGGQTTGWDIWEEDSLANNWPTLPQISSKYLTIRIGSSGNDWRRVTSTYGNDGGMVLNAPYPHNFVNYYHYWQVGPGPQ